MFDLIYRRKAINTFGDKIFFTELGMQHANENYGLCKLLLSDSEI